MMIQTCQAPTLAELTQKIRAEHGPQAVLLSVRKISPALIEGTFALGTSSVAAALTSTRPNVGGHVSVITPVVTPAEPPTPKQRCIVMVGPMGAGKTTTAAKIAGQLFKRQNLPVGMISTDTERPGGAALLTAYAEHLSLHATAATS